MANIIRELNSIIDMLCGRFGINGIFILIIIAMFLFLMYVVYRFMNYNENQIKTLVEELDKVFKEINKVFGKINEISVILKFLHEQRDKEKKDE